jgi:hypothetical protein
VPALSQTAHVSWLVAIGVLLLFGVLHLIGGIGGRCTTRSQLVFGHAVSVALGTLEIGDSPDSHEFEMYVLLDMQL